MLAFPSDLCIVLVSIFVSDPSGYRVFRHERLGMLLAGHLGRIATVNIEISRRLFLKGATAGVAATSLAAFGFGETEAAHAAAIRPFKLASL